MFFDLHVHMFNVTMKYHLVKKVCWILKNLKKVEKIKQRFLKEEASSRCIQRTKCAWASEAAAKYNDLVY